MKKLLQRWVGLLVLMMTAHVCYATIIIPMYTTIDGLPRGLGYIKADDTIYGLLLTPQLSHLPPGIHGFHIHQMPFCNSQGMAAGGHLDPEKTNHHTGPYHNGHLGDLPVLIVNQFGRAVLPVLAPRLKLCDIKGHSIVIHAGGDNYADGPQKMGGGGARIACGVINYF